MKKTSLVFISSIILFSLINIGSAQAGHVLARVLYNDGCPRAFALVGIYDNAQQFVGLCGISDETGYCENSFTGLLPNRLYKASATWNGSFFEDQNFATDDYGNGVVTIQGPISPTYPNGNETCNVPGDPQDSECDGLQYCIGNPQYIECRHSDQTPIWNQDCDAKKCCSCNGGTLANPIQNYNSSQNVDCPFCQKCTVLDTCGYQAEGEDLKDQCSSDSCKYGYCDGSGACKMKSSSTDCGTCALCNGQGNCNVYDPTQNEDCNPSDIEGISTCGWSPDSIPFTWDFRNAFNSQCVALDQCSQGNTFISHTCADNDLFDTIPLGGCGAECDEHSDCPGHACLINCFCAASCPDADNDGWDNCGLGGQPIPGCTDPCDCDDSDANIHPGAVENCADGKDNDCNTCTDTIDYSCGGIETSCSDAIDNDCNGCSDTADFRCGGTDIICNNYDDDCDGAIDEDYVSASCGSGGCIGATSCVGGQVVCSSSGNSCNDGLYCNGADKCNVQGTCVNIGPSINCSSSNLQGIATCDWNPDNYHPTWDFRNPFTSICNENLDICTTGNTAITHTCNKTQCSAQCEKDSDCSVGICRADCTCGVWESIYSGSYPVIDIEEYNSKLYFASNKNEIYIFDGSNWNTILAPLDILSLQSYDGKLYVAGGPGKVYTYDGSAWSSEPVLSIDEPYTTEYLRMLGVYNDTLYAGSYLDKPVLLYYCNGSCDNSSNWHLDTDFNSIITPICGGPFCNIDAMGVYNGKMYLNVAGILFVYNGSWSILNQNAETYSVSGMKVYNSKLYLATRDQNTRCPMYEGYSGFCGRVIEFDGTNWNTVFDHTGSNTREGYWMFSLEVYNGRLYAGTANRIYMWDGIPGHDWQLTFNSVSGAEYVLALKTWNNKIYAGFGNGVVAKDDMLEPLNISVLSPQNTTYTSSVPLTFITNRPPSWIGYSLDNNPNVTITGNTTLTLTEGAHNIIIYAKDSLGTTYFKVYFTVKIPKPDLMIGDIWTSGNTVYYKIRNQGNANAGYSYSDLYVDGYYKTNDYVPLLTSLTSSSEYFSYSWVCSGTSDTIKVCADGKSNVAESNENNNCLTKTFTCPIQTCTCTAWEPTFTCCSYSKEKYTRTCNPRGCQSESKCEGPCFV